MDEGSLTVLVLGGTGFIGRRVAGALRARGHKVIVASRSPSESVDEAGLRRIRVDVLDRAALTTAAAGADCVVNCYRDGVSEAESAIAIANILHACAAAGVPRLVTLSSIAVYGSAEGVVDEWTPPVAPVNWYGRAKSAAERACHAAASEAFRVAVLRPTLVYGPGGGEWFLPFMRSVRAGRLRGLGAAGKGYANLIYVDDLAQMCRSLAVGAIPPFSIAIANGDDVVSYNQYFDTIAEALGIAADGHDPQPLAAAGVVRARRLGRGGLKVLRRVARPVAGRMAPVDRLLRSAEAALRQRPEDAPPGSYAGDTRYVSRTAAGLGLAAPTPLREGVARSLAFAPEAGLA